MKIKKIKRQIAYLIVEILSFPTIFMQNKTRKQYFKKNAERFVGSFSKMCWNSFLEFDALIEQLPYSDSERKKARVQYKLLYHLAGLEVEEYQVIGGLYRTSFLTKLFCCATRWRQNTFQFSVNKFCGNDQNRALLDDKAQFNTLFEDLIGRKWILSNAKEVDVTKFIQTRENVIVKPL